VGRSSTTWPARRLTQLKRAASVVAVEPLDFDFQAVLDAFALLIFVLDLDLQDQVRRQVQGDLLLALAQDDLAGAELFG
jgi:hypothetical protein